MIYLVLAYAVVGLHVAFVVFVCLGSGLVWLRSRVAILHLPALAWAVWIEWSGGICPLTPLEVRLRGLAGQAGYEGGFLDQYVWPVLYPDGLSRQAQWILGALLLGFNALAYGALVVRRMRAKGREVRGGE